MDADPSSNMTGQFRDVSLVEKFELSLEQYEKRTGSYSGSLYHVLRIADWRHLQMTMHLTLDTVRAYKQQHKLGRFAPSSFNSALVSANDISPIDLPLGSRCQIRDGGDSLPRRGTVRFVGQTGFGKQDGSFWVGIELDEPLGRNDGW
jgi:tubulin-folding cofactor B